MITVITPIHDYKFLSNSLDNFLSQNYNDKELLLIVNGKIDHILDIPFPCYQVLTKETIIGAIRNVGLDWMAKNNRTIFSFFDSDDYYSSNYLSEAIEKLKDGYDMVGKLDFHFEFENNIYLITGLKQNGTIHGPTMTGYLSGRRFDPLMNLAEDINFVQKHSKIGYTSSNNFIYSVRENSIQARTFNCLMEQYKFYNTESKNYNCKIYKNGNFYWEYGCGYNLDLMFK